MTLVETEPVSILDFGPISKSKPSRDHGLRHVQRGSSENMNLETAAQVAQPNKTWLISDKALAQVNDLLEESKLP
jgi:hypothetical protein